MTGPIGAIKHIELDKSVVEDTEIFTARLIFRSTGISPFTISRGGLSKIVTEASDASNATGIPIAESMAFRMTREKYLAATQVLQKKS